MILGVFDKLKRIIGKLDSESETGNPYEFCPRCEANLTLQRGYDNALPYWICKGCGEMLINPNVEDDSNIAWICDECEAMLNIQPGFSDDCGEWVCTECGHVNEIDRSELFETDDEYRAYQSHPYKGMSDDDVLALSIYEEVKSIGDRTDIYLVRNLEDSKLYVKKFLTAYDPDIYAFLKSSPINHMPIIHGTYEGDNGLIVIEEYIEGNTIAELLENGSISESKAIGYADRICHILLELHNLKKPIIHRDIKPSNVMITPTNEVYLLDMNVAKWFKDGETDDTRHMGTPYFAAPEQAGFGFSASSAKTDIYALGMLLNVMITGKLPKEQKAEGPIWSIIERCISLEADKRYTASELIEKLDRIKIDA